MIKRLLLLLLITVVFSCKMNHEQKTESGLRYIIHNTPSGARKIVKGNYITLVMTYRDDRDSLLFDSKTIGSDIRFPLEKIPFHGSFEEGLTLLSKGDSATFFVSADSMYQYLFVKKNNNIPQEQTAFRKNSFVRFDVKILDVQENYDAEADILMKMSVQEKKEMADLKKYIADQNITTSPDSAGYYLIMKEEGKGNAVEKGKIVTVEYEGRFFDNTVFDGTKMAGRPYHFMSGAHHVIPGWEMVISKRRAGDKFTLILPSKLGYGSEGIRNPSTGKYIVPPFTPLVFDLTILSVEDMPAVSGR